MLHAPADGAERYAVLLVDEGVETECRRKELERGHRDIEVHERLRDEARIDVMRDEHRLPGGRR